MLRSLSSFTTRSLKDLTALFLLFESSSAFSRHLFVCFSRSLFRRARVSSEYSISESFLRDSSSRSASPCSSVLYLRSSLFKRLSLDSISLYSSGEKSRAERKSLILSEASERRNPASSSAFDASSSSGAISAAFLAKYEAFSASEIALSSASLNARRLEFTDSVSFSEFLRRLRRARSVSSSPGSIRADSNS